MSSVLTSKKTDTDESATNIKNGVEVEKDPKRPTSDVKVTNSETEPEAPNMPTWLGILLSLACILCCSAFYAFQESYNLGNSVYYSLLTFITGDFVTTSYGPALPLFLLIFIGLAMISLTFHMIRVNIDNVILRMKTRAKQRAMKLQMDIANGLIDPSEIDIDKITEEILNECAGGFMKGLIPASAIQSALAATSKARDRINTGITVRFEKRKESTAKTTATGVGVQTKIDRIESCNTTDPPTDMEVSTEPISFNDQSTFTDPVNKSPSGNQSYSTSQAANQTAVSTLSVSTEPMHIGQRSQQGGTDNEPCNMGCQIDGNTVNVRLQVTPQAATAPVLRRKAAVKKRRSQE